MFSAVERHTKVECGVLLKLEFVQEDGLISFPADQQSLCRLTRRRPTLDQGVEVNLRVDPQHQRAEWLPARLFIENRHE